MLHERRSATRDPSQAVPPVPALPVSARSGSARLPFAPAEPDHADPVEHAIARLLAQHATGPGSPVVERAPPPSGASPYEAAGKALAEGRIAEALVLLADAAAMAEDRSNALLGLAVCAVRLRCFDEGLVLALESRNPGPGHPRASHVAGLCELERGNRRAAQAHLAAAARLARRTPEFREDLQLAQRTLLLMHLS